MPVAASEYQRQDSHMYCAEQINIPVTLPNVLKSYAKAAIRTQPYDLLRWTSAYFRALADGEIPPVKARLEYPPHSHPSGVTPHFLKALLNQYGYNKDNEKLFGLTEKTATSMHVTLESLLKRWRGLAFSDSILYQILMTGRLLRLPGPFNDCDLYRFVAIACGLLGNNLLETMIYVCEVLTHEAEGGSAMIPLKTFMRLYEYLADLDCSGSQSIIETGTHDEAQSIFEDEASLLGSSDSSEADSQLCSNAFSKVDTEIEVTSSVKDEAELVTRIKAGMSCQPSKTSVLEETEVGEQRRPIGEPRWNDSLLQSCSAATKPGSETETTRKPQVESPMPSEKSTYNDKKLFQRQFPEGTVEELGSNASDEVTKVQEERRRRRDVEMHSSTEKVKPTDVETTTAKYFDSPRSSPAAEAVSGSPLLSSSSPSLGKSHVGPSELGKLAIGCFSLTRKHRQTDKILVTRTFQLSKQVKGPEDGRKASPSHVQRNGTSEGSITAQNGNADLTNDVTYVGKKNRDKATIRKNKIKRKKDNVEIPRDSFEYDDPTIDENQVTMNKKSSFGHEDDLLEPREKIVSEAKDPLDYDAEESSNEMSGNEASMYSEHEEVEDMADYQPIGLENILQGICECVQPTKESTIAVSTTSATRIDPFLEFIEKMKAESSAQPHFSPEIPGIGARVKSERVTHVGLWLNDCARRQQGYVAPRNLRHFLCPNLDENTRYEDYYRTKTIGL